MEVNESGQAAFSNVGEEYSRNVTMSRSAQYLQADITLKAHVTKARWDSNVAIPLPTSSTAGFVIIFAEVLSCHQRVHPSKFWPEIVYVLIVQLSEVVVGMTWFFRGSVAS